MVIALIGESGTGKTTAANFFKSQGAKIIIADEIVKKLYNNNVIIEKIIATFGIKFKDNQQKVNKKLLREHVFFNQENLNKLENIIWPEMTKKIADEISLAQTELIILECPVLFNAQLYHLVDKIILITAKTKNQVVRIENRDQVSKDSVINMLNMQKKHLILSGPIDYIVANNGSLDQLLTKLKKILKKIEKKN